MAKAEPPDDLDQLLLAIRFELRSYLRSQRFLGVLGLAAAAALIATGYLAYLGSASIHAQWATVDEFLAALTSYASTLLLIGAALLGGDAISVDFGTAAGYSSLVLPIRRSVLLLGRFLAAFVVTAAVATIYFGTMVAVGFAVYGTGAAGTPVAFGLLLLLALAYLGVVFLLSAAFRRPTVGIVMIILLLYLVFPIVNLGLETAHVEPWFLLTYAETAVSQAFVTSPHIAHVSAGRANETLSLTIYTPSLAQGAAIMIGYFLGGLGGALAIFERKEVTG